MAKKGGRGFISGMFDVKGWLGFSALKDGAQFMGGIVSTMLNSDAMKKQPEESFDDAIARLNLTPDQLQELQRGYQRNFYIFLTIGILFAIYTIYLSINLHFTASIIAFVLTMMMFTYSYIVSFWAFQIKHKKLGCTFKEWLNNTPE